MRFARWFLFWVVVPVLAGLLFCLVVALIVIGMTSFGT